MGQSTAYPAHAVCRLTSRKIHKQRHTACAGYVSGRERLLPHHTLAPGEIAMRISVHRAALSIIVLLLLVGGGMGQIVDDSNDPAAGARSRL